MEQPHIPRPRATAYIASVAVGVVASLATLVLGLAGLDWAGSLPAPPLANNVCVDEKLRFFRDAPALRPQIVALGSSVTWRHFDGAAFPQHGDTPAALNAGFCGLQVNQTLYTARLLLDWYPSTHSLIFIVSPPDFVNCSERNTKLFDDDAADAYVRRRWPTYSFYGIYFDPLSLTKNTVLLATRRGDGSLAYDRYGTSFITEHPNRGLHYGEVSFDPDCFQALTELAAFAQQRGKALYVVLQPIHPEWEQRFDPSGEQMRAYRAAILRAIDGSTARLLDADHELSLEPEYFTDAIHLSKQGAQAFSRWIAQRTKLVAENSAQPAGTERAAKTGL